MSVLRTLQQVGLGLFLITLAAGALLFSDLDRRHPTRRSMISETPRLAVMQWASTPLLDDTVEGILQGLREQGLVDGQTVLIQRYNASADNATANLMARELTGGRYDMILTASTLALQIVAAANREHQVMHVFGGVTDPYGAGVGITGPEPHQRPPHLVGVGTFQPVAESIRIAREINPRVQRLGVVWSTSEDNSEACVRVARATCAELGIQLIEANAGNPAEVPEAIRSVLARHVDAVWIGGDTVAIAAVHTIVAAARAAGVPVFSNDPMDITRGVLFGLGASYIDVGRAVGRMGGEILRGADPLTFGVENLVPEVLELNVELVDAFPAWTFSAALLARAAATAPPPRTSVPGRTYHVGILYVGRPAIGYCVPP